MKLIVGLGNPGEKYQNTRHNLGFMVLDLLLEDLEPVNKTSWDNDKYTQSLIKKVKIGDEEIILAKPQTFMNLSGEAVGLLLKKYDISLSDLFVIHDDLDFVVGKIRVRFGGAAGGHKGVESIINSIKTDRFLRIRIGIGKTIKVGGSKFKNESQEAVEDYVLANFSSHDIGEVKNMVKEAVKTVKLLIKEGIEKYMSKYNKR